MNEIRQKISNHPQIKDLEREVVVYRVANNMDVEQIIINGRIEHFATNDDGGRILLPEFTREISNWIVSNDYQVKKRDNKNKPVLNQDKEFVYEPAYDSYQGKLIQLLAPLMKAGIINDDEENKRFDRI